MDSAKQTMSAKGGRKVATRGARDQNTSGDADETVRAARRAHALAVATAAFKHSVAAAHRAYAQSVSAYALSIGATKGSAAYAVAVRGRAVAVRAQAAAERADAAVGNFPRRPASSGDLVFPELDRSIALAVARAVASRSASDRAQSRADDAASDVAAAPGLRATAVAAATTAAVDAARATLYMAAQVADNRDRHGREDRTLIELHIPLRKYVETHGLDLAELANLAPTDVRAQSAFPIPFRRVPPLPYARTKALRELRTFAKQARACIAGDAECASCDAVRRMSPEGRQPQQWPRAQADREGDAGAHATQLVAYASQLGLIQEVATVGYFDTEEEENHFVKGRYPNVAAALLEKKKMPLHQVVALVLMVGGVARATAHNWARSVTR